MIRQFTAFFLSLFLTLNSSFVYTADPAKELENYIQEIKTFALSEENIPDFYELLIKAKNFINQVDEAQLSKEFDLTVFKSQINKLIMMATSEEFAKLKNAHDAFIKSNTPQEPSLWEEFMTWLKNPYTQITLGVVGFVTLGWLFGDYIKKFFSSSPEDTGKEDPSENNNAKSSDKKRGLPQFKSQPETWYGHPSGIEEMALSPDGNLLAVAFTKGGFHIKDLKTKKIIPINIATNISISSLDWHPSGNFIVFLQDKKLKIWDIKNKTFVNIIDKKNHKADRVTFSPNGNFLAYFTDRERAFLSTLTVSKFPSGKPVITEKFDCLSTYSIGWSPKEKYILVYCGDKLKIWKFEDSSTLNHYRTILKPYRLKAGSLSPDGKLLALVGKDQILIKKFPSLELVSKIRGPRATSDFTWDPSGQYLLSTNACFHFNTDLSIKVWDVHNRNLLTSLSGHSNVITSVIWDPKGNFILSGSLDGNIKKWPVTYE